MTCIAAIVHEGEVYMAGDSAVTNASWDLVIHAAPKVFRRDKILIGVAGRSRLLNVVEHGFVPPAMVQDDVMRYVAMDFIAALRETIKTAGHMSNDDGREEITGTLLLGIRGRIVEIGEDFYTCEGRDGYCAIGDGHDLAMGSLHSTAGWIDDAEDRLAYALLAAEQHKASVRRPFTILGPDPGRDREVTTFYGRRFSRPPAEAPP